VGELWAGVDDPRERVRAAVRAQYDRLFAALASVGVPVFLTPGNVDVPDLWPDTVPGVTVLVGGIPLPAGTTPRAGVFPAYMRRREDFDAAVEGLGPGRSGRGPVQPRRRIGRTECVNVGHFQRMETPAVLRW